MRLPCPNIAMYKLGLAGVLVAIEFILARFFGLDMSKFMRWQLCNDREAPPERANPVGRVWLVVCFFF